MVIPSPWHIYWVNHGGIGEAPSLEWQLPAGVSAGKIHWPLPKKHLSFGSIAYVYEQEVLLMVPLVLSKDLEPGEFEIKASAKWLECTDEECVQGKQLVAAKLTVGREIIRGKDEVIFSKWRERLPGTLPALDAEWAGPVAENSWRPLAFRVPVKDQNLEVEFFPYLDPKDEFAMQADVKVEREKGYATLVQQVESVGKKWPSQIPGVMRIGGKGYEVVLEVAEPSESIGKQEAPFLLSSGLGFGGGEKSQVELVLDSKRAKPGQTVMAGVRFTIPEDWHIYYKDPGGPGLPPEFTWVLPKGVEVGEIQWPQHEVFEVGDENFNGYHDEVMLLVPLTLAKDLAKGPQNLRVNVEWQECKDICVQGDASLLASFEVSDQSESTEYKKEIAKWQKKVPGGTSVSTKPDTTSESPGAKTKITLLIDADEAQPGQTIYAGVQFEIPKKWHIFWKNPGELGEAPKIYWELPSEVRAGEISWPQHEKYEAFGVKQNVYHDSVMLIVPLHLSGNLEHGEMNISARVTWQECEVSCVQGEAVVQAALTIGDTYKSSANAPIIAKWKAKVPAEGEAYSSVDWGQLGWMLLLAFAGGLILNLMPCVLPVIALKVMGFVNQNQESPGHSKRLGGLYGLGVIFSFLVMAGLLLAVRAGAGGETWGMQMQNKWFLLFLSGLMTLVALNLFGVFEISLGGKTLTAADSMARREGNVGAFANGMLMVALATPCLAPMLGTAIGFALTQPALVVLLVFVTVAFGLALPYVVLSFKPDWLKFLPKPGAWMESFKVAMGFPMLAAAIWLMTLAGGHFGDKSEGVLRVAMMLALLSLASWVFGEFIQRGTRRRVLSGFFAVFFVGAGFGCLFIFQDKLDWKPWSKAAVSEARAAGHPVLVDFTADWCLTCKVNKRTSIEINSVRDKVEATSAMVFKGDFTDKNAVMAEFIKSHGRPGVPLVLVYSPNSDEKPKILPELLTPELVLDALSNAVAKPGDTVKSPSGLQTDGNGQKQVDKNGINWQPWSIDSIAKAQEAGKPVLVDFTATWCAPCKHIEKTAINVPEVRKKLASADVVTLKADFTDKDPEILKEMQAFGRAGPPLVLVYPPSSGSEPIVMDQVFTAADMLEKLNQAVGKKAANNEGLEPADVAATGFD